MRAAPQRVDRGLTPRFPLPSNVRMSDWDRTSREYGAHAVSWYRPHLTISLRLLGAAGLSPQTRVIDVGAGASTLVDDLLDRGISAITLLDLSPEALRITRERLGERAATVRFIEGDITSIALEASMYDVWHDRAALHFLLSERAIGAYVRQAASALSEGGHAVIGGFATDGPARCSGRDVVRREPEDIAALFGKRFDFVEGLRDTHITPKGIAQHFAYALLRKRAEA
jgi:SAM-dependent methyltransferase